MDKEKEKSIGIILTSIIAVLIVLIISVVVVILVRTIGEDENKESNNEVELNTRYIVIENSNEVIE